MKFSIKNIIFSILKLIFVLMVLAIFYRTLFVETQYWSGTYYPNGNANGSAIFSPQFDWKEECIAWAINERGLHPGDANVPLGDLWECNKNCRLASEVITLIHATQKFKNDLLNENNIFYTCDDGGFDGADWLRGDF